jgi:hypothetical protein
LITFRRARSARILCAFFVAAAATLSTAPAFAGTEYVAGVNETTIPNQLLVRFQQGAAAAAVIHQLAPGATTATVRQDVNVQLVQLPQGTPPGISSLLAALPGVVYVEPNRVRKSQGLVPNDPLLSAQWALQNIQAMQAWGVAPDGFLTSAIPESGRVRVAVLDTGVDCTHPDFMNAGGGSTDTASGGQLNWSISKTYYTSTAPTPCPWGDDFGHGTHVAGIVAAAANNGQGVAGVGYPVELLVYKVLDSTGSGDDGRISQAIVDAVNNGASVISMSLGAAGYSQTLQSAINYAWQKNVLVVAAAGNSSSNALFFPADANYAMGVAATDTNDALAGFSNYGPGVAVGAPGVNIVSTVPTYGNPLGVTNYAELSGTSMSAPHVSAEGGMIFAASPSMTAATARMTIEQSADNGNSGGQAGQQLGYGRINLWRALNGTLRPSTPGGIAGQVVDVNGNPMPSATVAVAGQSTGVSADAATFRFYGLPAGSYTVTVSAAKFPNNVFQVNVAAGADTNFTPVIGGTPAQFSGVVTDNGQPVTGAVVEALSNGLIQATAVTGPGGIYTLYVQPGTYDLQTSGLYHVATTLSGQSVGANGNTVATLSLPAMGTIAGNVTLPSGTAAAAATISINGARNTTAITDNNGNYSTIGLPAGGYMVTASESGQTNVAANTAVNVDSASILNLQFGGGSGTPTQPGSGNGGFTTIRVHAGGGPLVDASGNAWSADYGFLGGFTYSDSEPVSDTATPALYQTQRYNTGVLQYQFAAPNGSYTVILKFAETWFTSAGQRVFNIALNGQQVATNFDIVAAAGGSNIAIDEAFPVNVTNGQIVIQLTAVVQNPEINAIEIDAGTNTPTSFTPIRVHGGGGQYTDSQGQVWAADNGYTGGTTYSVPNPIANTADQALYQTERYNVNAPVQYQFAAPNGSYSVTLKFSENFFSSAGERVFNIVINGQQVATNFDIVAAAGGPFTAVDQTFVTTVTNGQVVIQLTPVIQNPKIDSLQIATN